MDIIKSSCLLSLFFSHMILNLCRNKFEQENKKKKEKTTTTTTTTTTQIILRELSARRLA
jgi:hypothetical protein